MCTLLSWVSCYRFEPGEGACNDVPFYVEVVQIPRVGTHLPKYLTRTSHKIMATKKDRGTTLQPWCSGLEFGAKISPDYHLTDDW
jgi:hypothetical protein